jgi:signal transduction histidine kinase
MNFLTMPEAGDPADRPPQFSLASFAGAIAIALALVEVLFDWGTWIELNVSVLYSLPLVVAAVGRRRRLLWALAGVLICMTFAVYVSQVPPEPPASRPFLIDRGLSAISILLSAGILDAWLRSLTIRGRQAQAIEQQNGRLEATNAELLTRREEVSKKNEELERQRSEIEEISHRKTQMLASISHDVRSPIQAITLMAELIRRTAQRPDQVAKIPALAQKLQANAISVVDFLSEVIDIASFDTGRITINNSEFDLDELISLQRERVLPMAENKGLTLLAESCKLRLRTDRVKLGRVIGNLMGNAIKFTSSGCVSVGCGFTQKDGIFVRVADTGRGIRPEDLDRIFAEFEQVDESPPQLGSGWGLGLPISRRMVKLLGGHIKVQSVLGQGSTFTISLPPSCLVISEENAVKSFLGARPL